MGMKPTHHQVKQQMHMKNMKRNLLSILPGPPTAALYIDADVIPVGCVRSFLDAIAAGPEGAPELAFFRDNYCLGCNVYNGGFVYQRDTPRTRQVCVSRCTAPFIAHHCLLVEARPGTNRRWQTVGFSGDIDSERNGVCCGGMRLSHQRHLSPHLKGCAVEEGVVRNSRGQAVWMLLVTSSASGSAGYTLQRTHYACTSPPDSGRRGLVWRPSFAGRGSGSCGQTVVVWLR
jgi:hypothetical protein